jgi:hypothetical protein
VGGTFFSFNALENGLLRGNRVPPYHLSATIAASGDARVKAVLPLDARVHAALNCGARSCPPIKRFTAEAIDEELDVVAQAFFEQEANCALDAASKTLRLTMIVKWYSADFGASPAEIAVKIASWLSGAKREALEAIAPTAIRLAYAQYDWSTDALRHRQYARTGMCSLQ